VKWYYWCKGKGNGKKKGVPIFGVPKTWGVVIPYVVRTYDVCGVFDSRHLQKIMLLAW
jgi:hypothetical protein